MAAIGGSGGYHKKHRRKGQHKAHPHSSAVGPGLSDFGQHGGGHGAHHGAPTAGIPESHHQRKVRIHTRRKTAKIANQKREAHRRNMHQQRVHRREREARQQAKADRGSGVGRTLSAKPAKTGMSVKAQHEASKALGAPRHPTFGTAAEQVAQTIGLPTHFKDPLDYRNSPAIPAENLPHLAKTIQKHPEDLAAAAALVVGPEVVGALGRGAFRSIARRLLSRGEATTAKDVARVAEREAAPKPSPTPKVPETPKPRAAKPEPKPKPEPKTKPKVHHRPRAVRKLNKAHAKSVGEERSTGTVSLKTLRKENEAETKLKVRNAERQAKAAEEPKAGRVTTARRKVRRYREEHGSISPVKRLEEKPGKVGKVVRQRRKIGVAAAVAPVAVSPSQGVHSQGPGFAAVNSVANAVGGALPGPVGNAAKDLIEFPAQTIPMAYAIGHGGLEAAKGNPSELQALWDSYKKHGFLPKVASGDIGGALKTFEKHPVFSAAEVGGLYAGVGRGLGGAMRHSPSAALREIAATERSRHVAGGIDIKKDYSPNVISKQAQRVVERHREAHGGGHVSEAEANRYIKKRLNHTIGHGHARHREVRATLTKVLNKAHPRKGKVADHAAGDMVSFVAQRAIRRPDTWHEDIGKLRRLYEKARKRTDLTKPEQDAIHHNLVVLARGEDLSPKQIRKVFQSAEHYVKQEHIVRPDLARQGHYDLAQTERASLIPYARTHMGAKYEDGKLVDARGNDLSTEAIKAHMLKSTGSDVAGFVTHRPQPRNAYYVAPAERPRVPHQARTGEAFVRGTFDSSYQALAEQLIRSHSIVNATDTFDQVARELGARAFGSDTPLRFHSAKDANLAASDPERFKLDTAPGERYVPFRITSTFPNKAELRAIDDHLPREEVVIRDLESRLSATGKGEYVIIPQSVASLMRQHFRAPTQFEKGAQMATTQFKATVLPTSPSFFTGNFLDNYIVRPIVANVGPMSYIFGKRLFNKVQAMDPELANKIAREYLGGTFYGSTSTEAIFRSARDFDSRVARVTAQMLRAPGIRTVRRGWNLYRNTVMDANKRMERQPQIAGLGKVARHEIHQASGSWVKAIRLQEQVVTDFMRKVESPDHAVQFAQEMYDMWGKWDNWSPSARFFLQTYSPFGSWLYNASRLALWTLPVKHPMKAALIAAMENATSGEQSAEGKRIFSKRPVPGSLQGGIPWGPGGQGIVGVSHFTSFGIFDDPTQTLHSALFPQFMGGLNAAIGVKWTGQQLVDSHGKPLTTPQRMLAAANATIETYVPIASWYRRMREGGPSADTSSIFDPQAKKIPKKYQSGYKGGLSLLNPFQYYDPQYVKYLRAPKKVSVYPVGGSSSSGNSNPWGSSSGGWGSSSNAGWGSSGGGGWGK